MRHRRDVPDKTEAMTETRTAEQPRQCQHDWFHIGWLIRREVIGTHADGSYTQQDRLYERCRCMNCGMDMEERKVVPLDC